MNACVSVNNFLVAVLTVWLHILFIFGSIFNIFAPREIYLALYLYNCFGHRTAYVVYVCDTLQNCARCGGDQLLNKVVIFIFFAH